MTRGGEHCLCDGKRGGGGGSLVPSEHTNPTQSWRKRYSRANKKQRAEDEVRRAAARGVTPEKYLTIAELAALQAKNEERERQSLAQ